MDNNKKFFIIKKHKFLGSTSYSIHSSNVYDLTTAVKKLLALDTLEEDKKDNSYHLQEVNFSMVDKPLVLTDEVKEDKNWKECVQEDLPF
tara:strand:+ start:426 stop:695 length:270 start_codon:yes stop_codon:yes gene_type:complete